MRQFCIFSILCCAFAYGQHFQTRFQGAGLDSYEASTPVGPAGITAGQSNSFPAAGFGPRVLLTRFNGAGAFNWNRVYPNLPNQFADYEAVDIKPVAASGGLVAGYYVVGHFRRVISTTPIANRDLFLTRITNNGIVIWHRELATVPAPAIGDAEAVSVEVLADNSAVVVGNLIPFSGFGTSVIVSRVTPTGTTMFCNLYRNPGCSGALGNIVAREAAVDVTGAPQATSQLCNGSIITTPPMPEAVIITGEIQPCSPNLTFFYGGGNRMFAMKVNGRGIEIWRYMYPSAIPTSALPAFQDAGHDIVQQPNNNFTIAGGVSLIASTGLAFNGVYAVEIAPTGLLSCGRVFLNQQNKSAYARAITLSHNPARIVVAGPIDSLPNVPGTPNSRNVFAMEFGIGCTGVAWSRIYPRARPSLISEGINRYNSPNPDYFLSSNSSSNTLNTEGYAMRLNSVGGVPTCFVANTLFFPYPSTVRFLMPACTDYYSQWVPVTVTSINVQPTRNTCYTPLAPPMVSGNSPGDETGTDESLTEDGTLMLYPNPVTSRLQLRFAAQSSQGQLQVFNHMGQLVDDQLIANDAHETSLDVTKLPAGVYTLRIRWRDGVQLEGRFLRSE